MKHPILPAACLLLLLAGITASLVAPTRRVRVGSTVGVDLSAYPWLYVRDGQPVASDETGVSVVTVGDVLLGRGVARATDPFGQVSPVFHSADLVMGNLETAIVGGDLPAPLLPANGPQPIILNSPLTSPATLRDAGFSLLGLANNHTLDYGAAGLAETSARLQQAGLLTVGAGRDIDTAYQPQIVRVRDVRLAFLAFNAILPATPDASGWVRADWNEPRALEAVAAARTQADAVIVLMHWGDEYAPLAVAAQQRIAQALVGAGADLVVGSHPHVIQGTQVIGKSFVAYSMGNFAFDQDTPETTQGLALRALFDARGLRGIQALPIAAQPRPWLLSVQEAADLLPRIQPPPIRIGFACQPDGCSPVEVPQAAEEGLFWGGQSDLTGDGKPEIIRREGGRVLIYQAGQLVYQTPPEWRIADVALGDPNNDGRSEVMLALWRADANGVEWSQPYIVGYRGGEYKLLWGGRAVFDPLLEIEVGDVDGDDNDELVVLEQRRDGNQAITIWRWVEWSFSLVWRSPEGRYRDMALLTVGPGKPPLISVAQLP